MHVDIKYTMWQRLYLNEEQEEKISKMIEENHPDIEGELLDLIGGWEDIDDSYEWMTPTQNFGCSTVELFKKDGLVDFEKDFIPAVITSTRASI